MKCLECNFVTVQSIFCAFIPPVVFQVSFSTPQSLISNNIRQSFSAMSASFSKFMKYEIRDEEFELMGIPRHRKACATRVQNPQELLDANREGGPFTSAAVIPIEPCFAMQTDMLIPSCPHLANLVEARPHKHDKVCSFLRGRHKFS